MANTKLFIERQQETGKEEEAPGEKKEAAANALRSGR